MPFAKQTATQTQGALFLSIRSSDTLPLITRPLLSNTLIHYNTAFSNYSPLTPVDMAEQQLTAALSDMSVSDMPPKLPNFPLPRELRDKIYGYLLDGDYTRVKRNLNRSETQTEFERLIGDEMAYHFHTNILAVNRTIHEEAEELLYKRNVFVVISYQWPRMLDMTGGWFWLLTVSKKHVARMTRHSLRIHASPGTNDLAAFAHETGQNSPIESRIILAKDLEAACLALLVPAANTSGPGIAVTNSLTGVLQLQASIFNDRKARSMQLKCELRNSTYRSMSAALQQSLLTPLAVIIAPCQRVVFTGKICDVSQTENLKRAMAPTLLCRTAVFWAYFEALMLRKELADTALEHDGLRFVIAEYVTLECLSVNFVERSTLR